MSTLVCLLPGLTDVPLQDLNQRTPLEVAKTPTLDALPKQIALSSAQTYLQALIELLRVRMVGHVSAQGPLEALATGVSLNPSEVVFSIRFVATSGGVVVDVADTLLSDKEGQLLCAALNQHSAQLGLRFYPVQGPQVLLVAESTFVSAWPAAGVEPNPIRAIGRRWYDLLPVHLSQLYRERLHQLAGILAQHELNRMRAEFEQPPIKGILFGEGGHGQVRVEALPPVLKRVSFFTASLASVGLGKSLQMAVHRLSHERTAFANIPWLLEQIEKKLARGAHLLLELPYVWEPTFHGQLLQKIKRLEYLDRYFIEPLVELCRRYQTELLLSPLKHADIRTGWFSEGPVAVWGAASYVGKEARSLATLLNWH